MKDKIEIEELKMFQGTKLKCSIGFDLDYTLDGIIENLAVFNHFHSTEYKEIKSIRPQVKPISKMSNSEINEICLKVDAEPLILGIVRDGKNKASNLSLRIIQELAKRHKDIFNWIERGLADELEGE